MSASISVPLAPLYGSLYFSAVLTIGFYGVTCMQTFFYYIHYPEDPLPMKSLVGILWVLDTIHQSLVICGVYKYIIAGLVNRESVGTVVLELIWDLLVTTLVVVPTQAFFVYRIYLFTEKNIIAPLLWFPLGIFQLVSTFLYVGKSVHINSLATTIGLVVLQDMGISYCSIAAGVDISIAICLTCLLVRRRIATGFKHTAKALQLLTVFAINTGIWTAIFALLTIVMLRAFPTKLIYMAFDFPLCSIYCNTLLANLNARSYMRDSFSPPLDPGADLLTNFGEQNDQGNIESNRPTLLSSSQATNRSELTGMTERAS